MKKLVVCGLNFFIKINIQDDTFFFFHSEVMKNINLTSLNIKLILNENQLINRLLDVGNLITFQVG